VTSVPLRFELMLHLFCCCPYFFKERLIFSLPCQNPLHKAVAVLWGCKFRFIIKSRLRFIYSVYPPDTLDVIRTDLLPTTQMLIDILHDFPLSIWVTPVRVNLSICGRLGVIYYAYGCGAGQ